VTCGINQRDAASSNALQYLTILQFNVITKIITEDRGAPKSAGPVVIATFATIVNPVLYVCV